MIETDTKGNRPEEWWRMALAYQAAERSVGVTSHIRRLNGAPLTPRESAVAGLVARGATNKEAAAALFVSAKTVEFHLSSVYRKLGVRCRSELAWLVATVEPGTS